MKGRLPKSAELHQLHGTRSHVKLPRGQVAPTPPAVEEVPPAPASLDDRGVAKWNEKARELIDCGVLKTTDLDVLESYCIAYETMTEARVQVRAEGATITGGMGGSIKNPAVNVMKDAQAELRQLSAVLGLNPSARTRIGVPAKPTAKRDGLAGLMPPPRVPRNG